MKPTDDLLAALLVMVCVSFLVFFSLWMKGVSVL
jgi:hypothetical protein